jgi:RNA polymerase sigma-70 factor (ECF subfamily)
MHESAPNAASSLERCAHPCAGHTVERFYADYFDSVWRTLRALGVPNAALDDAVQDVFLAVHRQLHTFEERSSPKTWIYGFACNVASNYRRRERRKGGLLPLNPAQPVLGPDPHDKLEQARAWAYVNAFLASLDEGKRMVYVLSRFEGLSAPEIAQAAAIPLNTVYSRIHAVETAFRRFLSAQGQGEFP